MENNALLNIPIPVAPYEKTAADLLYVQELLWRAKNRTGGIFNNSKPYHASVVMENIFRETRHASQGGTIRIYGKNLNGEISGFDNYRYELTAFLLAPNTHIKVIIDEEPEGVHATLNAFQTLRLLAKSKRVGNKIGMRIVQSPENVASLILKELEFADAHFAVSTENMYRLEIDSKLHFAQCSFNDQPKSAELIRLFDRMFDNQDGHFTNPLA